MTELLSPTAPAVEMLALDEIHAFEGNSKAHPPDQVAALARSIREFGFTAPVLIDETGTLLAGHGRVMAAREVGLLSVPAIRVTHLTPDQKRAYVIADNRLTELGGWDEKALAEQIQMLMDAGVDVSVTGFDDKDSRRLLAALGAHAGLTDPDDAPALQEKPISRIGDVWILGRHRIVCGSSTDAAIVDLALNGEQPHLMVTDPPYGVKYDPSWRSKAGLHGVGAASVGATGAVLNDDVADWRGAWKLFPGDVVYVWHGGLHAPAVAESLEACKFAVRAQIIWAKTRPVIGRGHYHWQHEPCLYGVREGVEDDQWHFVPEHEVVLYGVRGGATGSWNGSRKQSTLWFIEHIKSDTGHGTQKPVECMRRPIENNSIPGQAVYEPFSGSGTTIIAAEMTGRSCHAIELNPLYVDVAVRRWQEFTGRKAVHAGDGVEFDEIATLR